jgi:hypothetical protein
MRASLEASTSDIPDLLDLFTGCGTQQTDTSVDLPSASGMQAKHLRLTGVPGVQDWLDKCALGHDCGRVHGPNPVVACR